MFKFTMPIRTQSEANVKEHFHVKAKRAKSQREASCLITKSKQVKILTPSVITLTRISPRTLDTDNLARSFKAVRDGIADAIQIDDGDDTVEWRYAQMKGAPKEYFVGVMIQDKEIWLLSEIDKLISIYNDLQEGRQEG